jgi:signal transduction histidine kinase
MLSAKRNLFLTSAAIILAAASCMTLFYRHVAVRNLVNDAESSNKILALEVAHILSPNLENYLAAEARAQSTGRPRALPRALLRGIEKGLARGRVTKISIYDHSGEVVYSSDPADLGTEHARDAGVAAALSGKIVNEFQYKDTLSRLETSTAQDNMVHSFVPVVHPSDERVVGVFEVHTDANPLVAALDRTALQVMLGGLLGFALLLGALMAALRRTGKIIEAERRGVELIRRQLSRASLRMLRSEESVRRNIATNLESGIVQSLSAVKLSVEAAIAKAAKGELAANDPALGAVIPVMHEIIAELSTLAAELHPPGVLELGLLPALEGLCNGYRRTHPSLAIGWEIECAENEVPRQIKMIVYRTVQNMLEHVVRQGHDDYVAFDLLLEDRILELRAIPTRSKRAAKPVLSTLKEVAIPNDMESAAQLVLLSGGTFAASADGNGIKSFTARWPLDSEQMNSSREGEDGQTLLYKPKVTA